MIRRAMGVVLVVVAAAGCTGDDTGVDAVVGEGALDTGAALDDDAFRFCHEDGYDGADAAAWCELMDDDARARCPGLAATCDGAEVIEPATGCERFGPRSGGDAAGRPDRPNLRENPLESLSCDCKAPEAKVRLPDVLQWVAAIAVALGIAALVGLLLRALGLGRDPRASAAPEVVEVIPDVPEDPEELPEGEPEDLLAGARAALAAGRYEEAARLARGTALRALGVAGRVKLHRARTDREYVRALRGDAALQRALREVVNTVEGWRFGGLSLGEGAARRAVDAAAQILKAVAAAVLLLAVLAAPAHAGDVVFDRFGPFGDAAVEHQVRAIGGDVASGVDLADPDGDLQVILLDADAIAVEPEVWEALLEWVDDGGVLFVFGVYGGEVPLGELVPVESGAYHPDVPRLPGGVRAVWTSLAGYTEAEVPAGVVAQWVDHGDGAVVAVSDSRVLANAFLVSRDNERWLRDVLRLAVYPEAKVGLATWPAGGADNPNASLANARLLPFVLQLLLLLAVAAIGRGWAFGRLREPRREGREDFVEHVRALGRRWELGGASGRAAREVSRLWLSRLGTYGLDAAARRAGMTPEQAAELVGRATEAAERDDETSSDPAADLRLVEALWKVTRR